MTGEHLRFVGHDDAICEVELQHPPTNALSDTTLAQLDQLLDLIVKEKQWRAVVFSSRCDSGFSSGAELDFLVALAEKAQASTDGREELVRVLERAHQVFSRLDHLPLATIASVHGVTFGGGLEWALCCDVVYAERSTRVCLPELRLGLIPGFGGLTRLRRRTHLGASMDLLLTGRSVGTKRALQLGLLDDVVPNGEGRAASLAAARQMAKGHLQALRRTKSLLKPNLDEQLRLERAMLVELLLSDSTLQALREARARTDALKYLP